MPELPDLTVVAEQLAARATGKTIAEASAPTPILLRATPADLDALVGLQLGAARRRGKFLLIDLERDEVVLGRDPVADVRLDDRKFSDRNPDFRIRGQSYFLDLL